MDEPTGLAQALAEDGRLEARTVTAGLPDLHLASQERPEAAQTIGRALLHLAPPVEAPPALRD